MDDRRFDQSFEAELEQLLAEELSAPPPEDILTQITPWRKAMNRALAGLILTSLTLNFLWLDYLLPTIGYIQLLLGLRVLRKENGFFRLWWAVNLARSAWFFFCLLRNAVPGREAFYALPPVQTLWHVFLVLQLMQIVCLWQGLKAVQRRAGLPPQASGGALIVWHIVILALALANYQGLILGLLVVVAYLCIFRGLYRLAGALDEAGYAVRPAPVRVPDRVLVWCVTAALLAGLAVCYLLLGRFPMDWKPAVPLEHSPAAELEAHLLDLGFPEEVLNDLALEDLLACEGAVRVVSNLIDYPRYDYRGAPDEVTARFTGVAVELAGERERWLVFHHFALLEPPPWTGTYALQLWPAWHIDEGWAPSGKATGQVLYDQDGTTYVSPYFFLDSESYTSDTIFWGPQTSTDVFASFSLPRSGENHRGYVTYETAELQDGYIINSWLNLVQPTGRFQYPVLSAQEWQKKGFFSLDRSPFLTIQTALQFFPHTVEEEGVF